MQSKDEFDPGFLDWLYQCPVSFVQLLWMEYLKHQAQLANAITDSEIRELSRQLKKKGLTGLDRLPPKA